MVREEIFFGSQFEMIQSNMEERSRDGGSGLYLWQQIGCGYVYSISSKKADGASWCIPYNVASVTHFFHSKSTP